MKTNIKLQGAVLAVGLLLSQNLLFADTLLPVSGFNKWDYNEYLFGPGQGNCILSNFTGGFTAQINSNFVDVVNNTTFGIGPDGSGEGPQGRPAIFFEFPDVDLSQNGQKLTCTYNIKFNNELKNSDQFIRFGFINTKNNNAYHIKADSLQAGGTTMGARNDATTTDTTGATLYDPNTNNPAGNYFVPPGKLYVPGDTADMNPNLVNLNQPNLGPNGGFVPGIYSHCFSSGGSAGTGGSLSGGDIGAYPNNVGFGVPATLSTIHFVKLSIQRRVSLAGDGLKCQFAWTNDAGTQITKSGEHNFPYFNDSSLSASGFGKIDKVGSIAWNMMANDMFVPLGSTNFGSYTVSNVRLIYEWLRVTDTAYNPVTDSLKLVWASTPYNIDTATYELSAKYSIEGTPNLDEPVTWTNVATNIVTQGDFTTNTIASVSASPYRFFRIQNQAP